MELLNNVDIIMSPPKYISFNELTLDQVSAITTAKNKRIFVGMDLNKITKEEMKKLEFFFSIECDFEKVCLMHVRKE